MRAAGWLAVLIVDEAQRLPLELLEEIRLLLNLETPREKLLQIIMAGQPELGVILGRPELRQLKQRVSAICRLEPLKPRGASRIHAASFEPGGASRTEPVSRGCHRSDLQVHAGDSPPGEQPLRRALQTGFALQSPRITASIIQEAADDLELSDSDDARPKKELSNGDPPKAIPTPVVSPEAQPIHALPQNGLNGNGKVEIRIPLESYASRQRSLGFFGQLLDRWK